jgi:AraC-like DNA-binding protein
MKKTATFSTDNLPARDRFAHWREVRAEKIYGVAIELEPEKRLGFQGRFSACSVGDAAVVEMHASSYRVHRSERSIANAPSDSLCIYQQINNSVWFETGRRGEFTIGPGGLAISHSDLPYRTAPTTDAGFHLRIVKIPFALCRPLIEKDLGLAPKLLANAPGTNTMLAAYFRGLVERAPRLDGEAAGVAVRTLAQLALIARGLATPGAEPSRAAIRAAQLQVVYQFVGANLQRTRLSTEMTAVALGISVRQLHLLFEPTGTTFARYVQSRRLETACAMLSEAAERTVLDVAIACGFDSLSTFYRVFRIAYGVPPGDYRRMLRDRA